MNRILSKDIISYLEKRFRDSKLNCADFFKELKQKYKGMDVALICNYILENKDDFEILNQTLRTVNSNKYLENFDSLLKFIKKTTDINLKVLAIKTISVYKNTKALDELLHCLNDKESNYKVRFAAADAIGKIGGKNAFEALGRVVCDEDEKSAYVKESAVVALGNLGDKRAIDVFDSIMSSKQMFLDKFSYLKERVVEAISKLDISKDSRAVEILKKSLLESSPGIRISAIEALLNIDCLQSFDLIYDRLLYDEDLEVRKNALIALYNLSDRKILDEVVQGDFPLELKMCAQEIIDEYEDSDGK